jgi:hypothetical protein
MITTILFLLPLHLLFHNPRPYMVSCVVISNMISLISLSLQRVKEVNLIDRPYAF